jgi:cyclopropane-fatty-acyl-phospholipid synthase
VAAILQPLLDLVFAAEAPIRLEFWDGSWRGAEQPETTLRFTSPDALRRILWSPNELGAGRAYVAGELDVDGDVFRAIEVLRDHAALNARTVIRAAPATIAAARRVGAVGMPLSHPEEEAQLVRRRDGLRHTKGRDSKAISHHYDVGNDFYELVLGESMTYSCARFVDPTASLADAQTAKHELVCRKLGLHEQPGSRLLDVGCGWGSMAIHAATRHRAHVVGVTISAEQAEYARQRVRDAGVEELVEIRLQDYRDLADETFDAISSIGMSEHVGHNQLDEYFAVLHRILRPRGRLLNHAISSVGGSRMRRSSFVGRYVFPDGELVDVGEVALAMERAGFEVRDVESLREHYAMTLRHWVRNLEQHWEAAVDMVGLGRAKVWRLYMAGSAVGFEDGGIAIHQCLGVRPSTDGSSDMPATRRDWD